MALTLKDAITATQTTIDVNGTDALTNGDMYSLDDEYVLINTADPRTIQPGETAYQRVSLDRGVLGTRKAAHAAAATLTAVNIASGGGGGGVTVNSTPITNIVAAEAAIAGDEATVVTFPPGWSFNEDGWLVADSEIAAAVRVIFTSGVDPDVVERTAVGVSGLNIADDQGDTLFSADSSGVATELVTDGVFSVKDSSILNFRINAAGQMGFYGTNPVTQPAAIADATTEPEAVTQLNLALAALRTLGLIAT